MRLTIRKAVIEDAAAIFACYDCDWSKSHDLRYSVEDYHKLIIAPHIFILLAQTNEQVAGIAIVIDVVCWGYVDTLWIQPQYRRQGVGKALLEFAKHLNPQWRMLETAFLDEETGQFLTTTGFEVCEEHLTWAIKDLMVIQ